MGARRGVTGFFFTGLDLGQARNPCALAICELLVQDLGQDPRTYAPQYDWTIDVRHLERFPLGTAWGLVVSRTIDRTSPPRVRAGELVVDSNGVGSPVVEQFADVSECPRLVPVISTSGQKVTLHPWGRTTPGGFQSPSIHHVPKAVLIHGVQVLFERRKLRISAGLAGAGELVAEFADFRTVAAGAGSSGAEEYDTPDRPGCHGDLVSAVALAAWRAEAEAKRRWSMVVPAGGQRLPIG